MTHTFESLYQYFKTMPVTEHLTDSYSAKSKLIKYQGFDCLLTYLDVNPNVIHSVCLGYFIDEKSAPFYGDYLYPEVLVFDEGSVFIPHSLNGPSYLTESMALYIINGQSYDENEFKQHPDVVTHINKLSLKNKLMALK